MKKVPVIKENNQGNVVIYRDENDKNQVHARFQQGTLWLTQKLIADLFATTKQNVSTHLKRSFDDGELLEESVVKDFFTTATDGKSYKTKHYNLDAIIAVGYRVNSKRATAFRQWATSVLREYIIKGFGLADDRLKDPD